MTGRPLYVLFLSTGNAARSLVAEALLNAKRSDRFVARSAGIFPAERPHAETLALLQGAGLSVAGLHSKGVAEFLAAAHIVKIDVIVTLSEEARTNCPPWPGDPVQVHWNLDNPLSAERADVREWKFRKCLATLEARIQRLVRTRAVSTPCELFLQLKDIGMVV